MATSKTKSPKKAAKQDSVKKAKAKEVVPPESSPQTEAVIPQAGLTDEQKVSDVIQNKATFS